MALNIRESRWLQLTAALILIYFFVMDVSLYNRLQSFTFSSNKATESPNGEYHLSPISQIAMKTLLLDPPNHYIHVPLAVMFIEATNFSNVFPSITPNMISVSHVFVAACGMTLVWSDRLAVRQAGVLLFEVRSYLDALDGAVARSRARHNMIHLDIGSAGFFVDGICDTFGSIALYVGILVYLTSNLPSLGSRTKGGYSAVPLLLLPFSHPSKDSQERGGDGAPGVLPHAVNLIHKKRVVFMIICSALQMTLGSLFWNRTLDAYHSLLEIEPLTEGQRALQIEIFKSQSLWIIIWCWRLCNPHALLEMILISIFIDRLWEFLRWSQFYGFLVILSVTAVTQIHINHVTNLMALAALNGY
ncbi:ceramide phosphoethanolamine synthase-like [Ischnura elegans]|uniref:ceramide phosphoethanolamine synthase-like n=1 Tax=Ischnura elegans TaxID=197161 RepID=UPI001ED8A0EE|nr:ceramide phosphoethanolamine synthase-like [Ischnura elegans]